MIAFSASNYRFFDKKTPPYPLIKRSFLDSLLYHTKNYQGTITRAAYLRGVARLYHTKNYQGTITQAECTDIRHKLYHTKNYQGTITYGEIGAITVKIIPYQELSGE